MAISKPTLKDRAVIAAVQALFWNVYFAFYLVTPKTAHRFVGYLEVRYLPTPHKFTRHTSD